jgi:tagatose 6-phosphate kinase
VTRVTRVIGVSLNAAIDKTASVERLIPGEIHRPVVRSVLPGGKAVNVVRAAGHLGVPGSVVAVLGGFAGRWYQAALARRSIPLFAVDVDGETRECLSVLDEATGTLTELYETGVTLPPDAWPRVEAALAEALASGADGAVVVLAGSLPPGAPVDAYARLASIASASGARAVVDIDGEPLRAALAARPWLVKVNAREAATVTVTGAGVNEPLAAAQALRAAGAEVAIVTLGVDGAVLAGPEGTWSLGAVPPGLRGPFTVGSGDAFLAGFLAGLARRSPFDAALRLAAAAGAANARHPGQGEVDREEVDPSANDLEVVPVSG